MSDNKRIKLDELMGNLAFRLPLRNKHGIIAYTLVDEEAAISRYF
jgi:hypothetical protein